MSDERDPDVIPTWSETGLPLCDDACPSFDGKRCKAMGFRPDRFCEPMLVQLLGEAHSPSPAPPAETVEADPVERWADDGEIRHIMFKGLVDAVTKLCSARGSEARRILTEIQDAVARRALTPDTKEGP